MDVESIRVGSRLPLLPLERAGRPARAEELDARRGALRRRGLGGADATPSVAACSTKLGPVVRAVAQDERSQLRNRELATDRILEQLREATKVRRARRPTKPTRAAKERRLDEKKRRGQTKRLRRSTDD